MHDFEKVKLKICTTHVSNLLKEEITNSIILTNQIGTYNKVGLCV